jgi:hypothetical protein
LQKTLLYRRYTIHVLHWHQLYEEQKKKKATSEEMASILDRYVNRWQRWAAAGLPGIKIALQCDWENARYIQKPSGLTETCPVILARHNTAP